MSDEPCLCLVTLLKVEVASSRATRTLMLREFPAFTTTECSRCNCHGRGETWTNRALRPLEVRESFCYHTRRAYHHSSILPIGHTGSRRQRLQQLKAHPNIRVVVRCDLASSEGSCGSIRKEECVVSLPGYLLLSRGRDKT